MKILSIGNFGYGWDGSVCDEEHIAGAFESLGHSVHRVSRESLALAMPTELELPDFILIAQWDGYPPDLIEKLRKQYPCLIVYWAFDYQADGQEWHERLVNGVDLYLSKRFADIKYSNWRWFSQDFAPSFLRPAENVKQDIDVLFTGTYLPWATDRIETLKAVDEKYKLTIHSVNPDEWKAAGFKDVRGPVMDEQLPELIARAKINLSIDHTLEAGYWSDRNAQIMACGGFVLFRYIPMSESIFRHHVAYFFSTATCLQQIQMYLEKEDGRYAAARSGALYAQNNLMVRNRCLELTMIIGSVIA